MDDRTRRALWPLVVLVGPFAVATFLVDRVDGTVGTLALGWAVLVGGAVTTGLVLEGREVPRPWATALAVVGAAGWLTLAWYVVFWAAGVDLGPVGAAIGSLTMVAAGTGLGLWLAGLPWHRPPVPVLPVAFLLVLPPLVVWLAWAQGDRPAIEAMADDLEATGVPPYLVEVAGYDLEEVYPGTNNLFDGPGITYQLRPHNASVRLMLGVIVASSETALCPTTTPDCLDLYEQVELDGAVALVRRPDSPGDLGADLDVVLADVADAEPVTYGELAQLHPSEESDG